MNKQVKPNQQVKPIEHVTIHDIAVDQRGEELIITQVVNKEADYIKFLCNKFGWGRHETDEAIEYGMIRCDFGGEEAWFVYRDDDEVRTDIAVVYQEEDWVNELPNTRTLLLTHDEVETIERALKHAYNKGLDLVAQVHGVIEDKQKKAFLGGFDRYINLLDQIEDGQKDI